MGKRGRKNNRKPIVRWLSVENFSIYFSFLFFSFRDVVDGYHSMLKRQPSEWIAMPSL